jgi:hypothetical protein
MDWALAWALGWARAFESERFRAFDEEEEEVECCERKNQELIRDISQKNMCFYTNLT